MTAPERYRVLLVEDNELDARSMTKALTTADTCHVHRTADMASGIEALSDGAFDCILLDLTLPDSAGITSVETMVARSPQCPIVVLTGLDDPDVALDAVARGAQDYLVKNTITPELVVRAIRYAVARHSNETELREVNARLADMDSREQIARDLHDTVIQRLFATGMTLQAGTAMSSASHMAERMDSAVAQIDVAITELRQAIFGLHSVDEAQSLAHDLAALADSYHDTLGFDPVVRLGEIPSLPDDIHHDLVVTVREALSNVAKHAGATSATVSVFVEEGSITARITDNGRGPSASDTPGDDLTGLGLDNMRARAEAHRGSMRFEARLGGGTELTWSALLSAQADERQDQ